MPTLCSPEKGRASQTWRISEHAHSNIGKSFLEVALDARGAQEQRLEDYLVRGLMDFDDISYDDHADLLYDLAGQMVKYLLSYLSEEEARTY